MAFNNAVIDLSHYNGTPSFTQASANGVVGVIHKATQGTTYTDPMYQTNMGLADDAGLLWGAYHFGVGGDGTDQANAFLDFVKPTPDMLLVLDFESNPSGTTMALEDAQAFVQQVQSQTGIWPGLYSGGFLKDLLGNEVDPVLGNCWLWLAQYGSNAMVQATWLTWTLWQYTDGTTGPSPVNIPGIGLCDQNCFNGTNAELEERWVTGTLAAG